MENNLYSEVTYGIDVGRIHYLKRSDKIMVIDRLTGRWVMFPGEVETILPLIGHDIEFLNQPKIAERVMELTKELQRLGIGIDLPIVNESLNTVILKLTKACNLACTYCYDFELLDKARHMEKRIALDTIYQAIDLCKGKINFILHGGEPMLVWNFIEELVVAAYTYGSDKNVAINFIGQTNLTKIDEKKIQFSNAYNIRWGVSFDGMAALHDKYRVDHAGRGSYDTMLQLIRMYPGFIRTTNALSTITSANQDYLTEIAVHSRELGFSGWDWTLFQPIGRGRDGMEFDINIEALIVAWDRLFEAVIAGRFDGFAVNPVLKYLNNFLDGPVDNMCMRSKCGAGRDLLSVSFDGVIQACDCIDPCGPLSDLGNMASGSLSLAQKSSKAAYIRSREIETLRCGSCLWQAVCGGTCMARAGGINKISEHECLLSMHIFNRISNSIAVSDRLILYKRSCD